MSESPELRFTWHKRSRDLTEASHAAADARIPRKNAGIKISAELRPELCRYQD